MKFRNFFLFLWVIFPSLKPTNCRFMRIQIRNTGIANTRFNYLKNIYHTWLTSVQLSLHVNNFQPVPNYFWSWLLTSKSARCTALWLPKCCVSDHIFVLSGSVVDPEPNPDPYVFGPPGSGSGSTSLWKNDVYLLITCRVGSHGPGRASQETSWSWMCSAPSSWLYMMLSRPAHLAALSYLCFRWKFSLLLT